MVEDTLPVALQCGISYDDYWKLNLRDIQIICKAYSDKYIQDKKLEAMMFYRNADLIRYAIASCFSKDSKFPSIEEAFPTLFDDVPLGAQKVYNDKGDLIMYGIQQQDPEIFKQRLQDYAAKYNRKYQAG